jgi:hypothetical protein
MNEMSVQKKLVTVRRVAWRERMVGAGTITWQPPVVHAVDSSSNQRQFGLEFVFDLTAPSRRARIIAVFIRVSFDDPAAKAILLESDEARQVYAEELQQHGFGWFFDRFGQQSQLGTRHVMKAIVETPPDMETVTGTVRVDASIACGRLRPQVDHATLREPIALALRPGGIRPTPAVRLCFAADIERFSRFRVPEAALVQERFAQVMAQARGHAGIDVGQFGLQRSGDGQTAVFPPAVDESRVIPLLVKGLAHALGEANVDRADPDRIRLRIALHRGHISWGANGWIGNSPIAVQRLLDSPAARQALADHPSSDFVLIVSDVVYRDVIMQGHGNLSARAFQPVHVNIPAKNFTEPAWIYVPATTDQGSSAG